MIDRSGDSDDRDGSNDNDGSNDGGLWGPWLLALGAGLIGVAAMLVEGVRVLRERVRGDDEHAD